jgi:hypothetical protein
VLIIIALALGLGGGGDGDGGGSSTTPNPPATHQNQTTGGSSSGGSSGGQGGSGESTVTGVNQPGHYINVRTSSGSYKVIDGLSDAVVNGCSNGDTWTGSACK